MVRPVHWEVVHAQLDVQLQVFPLTKPAIKCNVINFFVIIILFCLGNDVGYNSYRHITEKSIESPCEFFTLDISFEDSASKKINLMRIKLTMYHLMTQFFGKSWQCIFRISSGPMPGGECDRKTASHIPSGMYALIYIFVLILQDKQNLCQSAVWHRFCYSMLKYLLWNFVMIIRNLRYEKISST